MSLDPNNLLTQLKTAAAKDGDVYVSIIPFSKDVNAGSTNYSKYWIDWADWDAVNGSCSNSSYSKQSSCVNAGKTWTPKNHNTWNGCATDRDQDYDTKNTTPTASNSSTPRGKFMGMDRRYGLEMMREGTEAAKTLNNETGN